MTHFLLHTIFSLIAHLPLRLVHGIGAALGRLTFALSPVYAQRIRENLQLSTLARDNFAAVLKQSVDEAGKSSIELPWIWKRTQAQVCDTVQRCEGWEHLLEAQVLGKGIILLTPHWGCFEVVGLYVGNHLPLTCLYRSPKQPWLAGIMRSGRERGMAKLATADVSGVRVLYKALKRGEAIGILPDQVPSSGEGEWVDFFGKPAYTMTLSGRLAQSSGAAVLLACAERLPKGQGYVLRIEPLTLDFTQPVPLQINQALEKVIARAPAQYLWSYNRYKVPKGT